MPGTNGIAKNFTLELKDYHSKRWKNLHKHLRKYLKSAEHEHLHKLHLEMKKLIALFHFVEYCIDSFDAEKALKPIMHLFKQVGKIRDKRNAELFALRFELDSKKFVSDKLDEFNHMKKLKNAYKKELEKFERGHNDLNKCLDAIDADEWKEYLTVLERDLLYTFSSHVPQGEIHEVRKKLKEALYLNKLNFKNSRPIFTGRKMKLLDELQDKIGNWHDINKFIRDYASKSAIKNNDTALAKISAEEQKMLSDVFQLTDKVKAMAA